MTSHHVTMPKNSIWHNYSTDLFNRFVREKLTNTLCIPSQNQPLYEEFVKSVMHEEGIVRLPSFNTAGFVWFESEEALSCFILKWSFISDKSDNLVRKSIAYGIFPY